MSLPNLTDDGNFNVTPEQLKRMEQSIRKSKRKRKLDELIDRLLERSKLAWLFHPEPFADSHGMFPFSTNPRTRGQREQFLMSFSWFSLIRRRSERIYQLGLGGLIFAPLVGWLVLNFSTSPAHVFPKQLGVLYLSGLFYVLASTLLIWRCPYLIKELSLHVNNSNPDRDKYLIALIEDEISKFQEERIYPINAIRFEPKTEKSKNAAAMYAGNILPVLSGFGADGYCQMGEIFLEFSKKAGFKIFVDSDGTSSKLELLTRTFGIVEGRAPFVVELFIRRPTPNEISPSVDGDTIVATKDAPIPSENDLIFRWMDADFRLKSESPKGDFLERCYANGFPLLYGNGKIEELAWIISRRKNWCNKGSRFFVWGLYSLGLLLFAIYLIMQTVVVWDAMELSKIFLQIGTH